MYMGPQLIVADRLADEALWAEVLNLGRYDVPVMPFAHEEVLRVISMAWEFRETDCTPRETVGLAGRRRKAIALEAAESSLRRTFEVAQRVRRAFALPYKVRRSNQAHSNSL